MTTGGIQAFENSQTSSFNNRQDVHAKTLRGKSLKERTAKPKISFKNVDGPPITTFSDYNGEERENVKDKDSIRVPVKHSMHSTVNQIKIAEQTNSEETESARSQMALRPKSILKGAPNFMYDKSNYELEDFKGPYELNILGNQV